MKGFFKKLYETKSIQMVPFFGYFPVKLRTFIGIPIEYKEGRSIDELVKFSMKSITDRCLRETDVFFYLSQKIR